MPSVAKISVSLSPEDLAWAQSRARRDDKSLSSVVTEALQRQRQAEARRALLEDLGASDITEAEVQRLRGEIVGSSPRRKTRAKKLGR